MVASGAARKQPQPNLQRRETLNKALCWKAETTCLYVPEGKRAGTASFVRYEKYSKATTIGEALKLGSTAEDLINDYTKGILKVTGGPVREKPLEIEDLLFGDGLTETDKALGRFLKTFHRVGAELSCGIDPKTAASKKSWCESGVMHAKRLMAQREAERLLEELEESGGKVTDEHVLGLLRKWAFRRNTTRKIVAPENRPVVDSDTFGVMRNQAGVWLVTHATRDYPAMPKVLLRWLLDTLPQQDVSVTSIHVNSGFASRRHRDRDNFGPTFMRALGGFSEGGQLWYWPEDDGLPAVQRLPEDRRVSLDLRAAPAMIDGNRAHEVEPFQGERFGIVFYTICNSQKIPKAIADELEGYGFRMPGKEALAAASHLFAPPKGYGLEASEMDLPPKKDPGAGGRPSHKKFGSRASAAKRKGESLLAKLRKNAQQKEETSGNADGSKGSFKHTVFGPNLKPSVLKLKSKDDPKGKLGVFKVKTKVGISNGLLGRMMAKHAQKAEREGSSKGTSREDAAAKASAEPTEKDKKSADDNGTKGGSGAQLPGKDAGAKASAELTEKDKKSADNGTKGGSGVQLPGKVGSWGLMARVMAAKDAKMSTASEPEAAAAGEEENNTPQKKRSNSVAASRSGSSGPPSTKKQKSPGKEGGASGEAKPSSKAGKSGGEEAKAAIEEAKAPSAGPAMGAAPESGPEPLAPTPAAPAPAPLAAAPAAAAPAPAPAVPAQAAPAPLTAAAPLAAAPAAAAPAPAPAAPAQAAPAPLTAAVPAPPAAVAPWAPGAVPEPIRAAAAALGLSSVGREAVNCQHFLLLANVLRRVEESPAVAISTLADYFLVLLHMGENPQLLLQTALDLLLTGAVPQEAIEAAISGAFGATARQMVKERGLAEAAQEGRRAKRSLKAPPPRLTLPEVLVAARAGDSEPLVRSLAATRAEGREAFFLVKVLQGAAGASMGDVNAAVAKAMVCAAGMA